LEPDCCGWKKCSLSLSRHQTVAGGCEGVIQKLKDLDDTLEGRPYIDIGFYSSYRKGNKGLLSVFRIRIRIWIRPDPKLFGLKDPDPSLFHTKLRNMFKNALKSEKIHHYFIHNS